MDPPDEPFQMPPFLLPTVLPSSFQESSSIRSYSSEKGAAARTGSACRYPSFPPPPHRRGFQYCRSAVVPTSYLHYQQSHRSPTRPSQEPLPEAAARGSDRRQSPPAPTPPRCSSPRTSPRTLPTDCGPPRGPGATGGCTAGRSGRSAGCRPRRLKDGKGRTRWSRRRCWCCCPPYSSCRHCCRHRRQ